MPTTQALDIVVVGAGLGGLAAAIALCDAGHRVTVFEAVQELVAAGAGIQIPPPSGRILRSWGLEDAMRPIVTTPKTQVYRDYKDGRLLGAIPLNPLCEDRYGAPWWTAHRADYQNVLLQAASDRGATIALNHRVIDVDLTMSTVTVQTANGTAIRTPDLIIGADGMRSRLRSALLSSHSGLRPSSICAYRALVPLEAMNADTLRAPLMEPDNGNVSVWLGPEHFLLAYPIRQGPARQYNLVLVHPEHDEHTKQYLPARFPRAASLLEVAAHYTGFCPQVQSVLAVVTPEDQSSYWIQQSALAEKDGILEWKLTYLDELPAWSSESGRVLVIGDAAHAQLPTMSAGASSALEDAVALSVLLHPSAISRHGLKNLVKTFEALRKPRTSRYQAMSVADMTTKLLKTGKAQAKRDLLLERLGDENRQACTDAMAQMEAEGIGEFNFGDADVMDWAWGYDVREAAEKCLHEM